MGKLKPLETDFGLFLSETHKWVMDSTEGCECAAKKQTPEIVVTTCHIYHHLNEARDLSDVDKNLVTWLMKTCPAI